MKSRFFKDTNGLGERYTRCPPDQLCICLRMNRAVYARLLREAGQLNMTSGEYIQRLMEDRVCQWEEPSCRPPVPAGCGCCRED